jgi:transcriptional regulator GlxA family with amidase domain
MIASAGTFESEIEPVRRILFLVETQFDILDLAGPLQVLTTVNDFKLCYEIVTASPRGGPTAAVAGLPVHSDVLTAFEGAGIDTLILIGGRLGDEDERDAVIDWLSAHARAVRRVCGIGHGVEPLYRCGLASPARGVRHWRLADGSDAEPRRSPIACREGTVWTAAGGSAAIDVALALVAEDLGEAVALAAAEALVMPLWRHQDDPQISETLRMQLRGGVPFGALLRRIRSNLAADLRVETLAEWCNMSPRTFARRFVLSIGVTPAAAVTALRLEAAAALLKSGGLPLKQVAAQCGFGSELSLRRACERAGKVRRPEG